MLEARQDVLGFQPSTRASSAASSAAVGEDRWGFHRCNGRKSRRCHAVLRLLTSTPALAVSPFPLHWGSDSRCDRIISPLHSGASLKLSPLHWPAACSRAIDPDRGRGAQISDEQRPMRPGRHPCARVIMRGWKARLGRSAKRRELMCCEKARPGTPVLPGHPCSGPFAPTLMLRLEGGVGTAVAVVSPACGVAGASILCNPTEPRPSAVEARAAIPGVPHRSRFTLP